MIETTASEISKLPKYPCLKRVRQDGHDDYIVFFIAPKTGVVIHIYHKLYDSNRFIGEYFTGWNEDNFFEPFNGEITIKSK